ncbi:Sulfite reductase [NADPH] subunit beta, partial [Neolecta irregularis DAH-3]
VVLAYLPYLEENDSPITVLQETKRAIDEGYWPLYTWKNGHFELFSERIKRELSEFLDRENILTGLVNRKPAYEPVLGSSLESETQKLQSKRAKEAYERLVERLSGPSVTILYGSDGGNAEALSKRLSRRAKARGLKPIVMAMDDYPIEELTAASIVIFISAVAGQGEFPQNARMLWSTLKNTVIDVTNVSFSVFGLGDSHYWPRKEDKMYYNKPALDLDSRLGKLGAKRLIGVGLGDDQDADGYETRYQTWEQELWKALDVHNVAVLEVEEPAQVTNEDIKDRSNFLRGTIAQGLEDDSTGAIAESDTQLTKFHGIYQQDDRDLREERKANGLEP